MKVTVFLMVQNQEFRYAGSGYTFLAKSFDLPIAPFSGLLIEEDEDDLDWLTVEIETVKCRGTEVICYGKDKIITDADELNMAVKLYKENGWKTP